MINFACSQSEIVTCRTVLNIFSVELLGPKTNRHIDAANDLALGMRKFLDRNLPIAKPPPA